MIHRAFASLVSGGLAAMLLVGPTAGPAAAVPPPGPALPSDFNGDGYQDLAVAAPFENVSSTARDGGLVNVIFGSATGLTAANDQAWTLDSAGVQGVATFQSQYGHTLASGDFDGDGYADLATGMRSAIVGGVTYGGLAGILYGGVHGLTGDGDQLLVGQKILGGVLSRDGFADALAAADFNDDGFVDLAIGGARVDAADSTVVVVPGSASGLVPAAATTLDRANTGAGETGNFGGALVAGDLDGDGYQDLAVGVPGYGPGTSSGAGAVDVVFGSATGLDPTTSTLWDFEIPVGVGDTADAWQAMATGDIDDDGRDELVVGLPGLRVSTCDCQAGGALVIHPAATRGALPVIQAWTEDSAGVPNIAERYDRFGQAVAMGDVDGDGFADVVIGSPGESKSDLSGYGVITILYGTAAGLGTARARGLSQDSSGVPSAGETGDTFGSSLAVLQLGRAAVADLAIGVPGEDTGATVDAGMVNVLYGATGGISGTGAQGWTQDSSGINDAAETGDSLGQDVVQSGLGGELQ